MTSLITRITNRITWTYLDVVDNFPGTTRDFSWKTRWRIKHDRNPMFVVVQDKFKVKEYARERGVKTAKTYYVTDKPETIPFDSLPDTYFIKANHGCKWNIYCKNKEFYYYGDGEDLIGRKNLEEHKLTRERVVEYCNVWLRSTYSKREWAYRNILPRIMAEEVLEQRGGDELIEYRYFTFGGQVKAIYVDSATASVNLQRKFVDPNWKEFHLKNLKEKVPHILPDRPETFSEMLEAAERLAQGFDFIRVDLYDTTQGIVLGEMSVYHNGGEPMPTPDKDFNKWLGDQWVLPSE